MATSPRIAREPSLGIASLTDRPLFVSLAIAAAVVCIRALGTVDADVSWQLWAAHQMNGGARLYRDIVEINPPLWFWMGMPIDWLAQHIHARSDHVLIGVIGVVAAFSLVATDRLLEPMAARERCFLLAFGALLLVALPWLQFGQREHIAMIGALPYAALIAARRKERDIPSRIALVVGAGAALGFALKHYFLLVPILLELWLVASQGRKWRPFRLETLAMAAIGVAYAAAVALWAGDYFSLALPLVLVSYSATGAERLVDLFQPAVLTAIGSLALLAAQPRLLRSEKTGFAAASAISAIGFAIAYFIQAKGWSYHALPFAAFAAMALAAAMTSDLKLRLALLAAPALLLLPFWISVQQAVRGAEAHLDVRQALETLHRGDAVAFIGTDPSLGWPDTLDKGLAYPSRYSSYWMMRAVVRNEAAGNPNPQLTRVGLDVIEETVRDYQCLPPKRIVVARPAADAPKGEFDMLAFFLRSPRFAQLMLHYRPIGRTSVQVFEQMSPLPSRSNCIRRVRD